MMKQSERVKKVLILPSWYPSAESPTNGVFVQEQARALTRRFDVTVLTPRFPSLVDQLRLHWGPDLIREDDAGVDVWRIRKLKLPTLRRFVPGGFFPDHAMVFYRKFAAAIRHGFGQYVARCGLPDLIHAHVVLPGAWIALELAQSFGIPIVLTEHSEPFAMHLTSACQEALVRDILTRVDRVCAVSGSLRDTINAFCPNIDVDVIGNLIDTEYFVPSPQRMDASNPFRFFFLGSLIPRKGVQYLLQAIRLLLGEGVRRFEVQVGGDGPYRNTLTKLACELGVETHCRFLGSLDRESVRDQMQRCDAFVLPSLGETFGIVLGEAMACGKPVLSTTCGGTQDVVTSETGILVPTANATALAQAMAGFLKQSYSFHPQRIRDSVVKRFGAESFLAKVERLYTETLRRPSRKQCA